MNRAEMLESLLRLSDKIYPNEAGDKLELLFKEIIDPMLLKSMIYPHRWVLRASKHLNKILYFNNKPLKEIYDRYR